MSKVVFVLGAGASAHLGFPTGAELIADMIGTLSSTTPLAEAVDKMYGNEVARSLAESIQDLSLESIDQFMQVQRDETLRNACRFTLTFKILGAEYRSEEIARDRAKLSKNWYHLFRQFLLRNPHLAAPHAFSFLTFNYDRSLEHFLKKALDGDGRILPAATRSLLDVFHLHGSFGPLPWAADRETVPYGGGDLFRFKDGPLEYVNPRPLVSNHVNARLIANRIAFPHDNIDYGIGLARRLSETELVVIIGFGFAPQNCAKILLPSLAEKRVPVVATALGLSDEAREYLSDFSNVELVEERSDGLFNKVLRKRFAEILGATELTN